MLTPEQEQFIAKCKSEGFNFDQMEMIHEGLDDEFDYHLTIEQVKFYAKKEFDAGQMSAIAYGLVKQLPIEQILFYAKKEFDHDQMYEICEGFLDGLSIEKVSLFARPDLHDSKMREIRQISKRYKNINNLKTKVALMLLES